MLEKLAGRLSWERTGSGIRVEIPARLDWSLLFFVVWLPFWSMGGRHVMIETFIKHDQSAFNLFWLMGWAFAECYVTAFIIWSLTGRTTLTVDPCQLEIIRRVIGIQIDKQTFSTADVCNLRYIPAANRGRSSSPSKISFEADDKTRSFASGLEDIEAFALIDKMLDAYKFPKDRALEYIGRP
jgi:hypothetical protein